MTLRKIVLSGIAALGVALTGLESKAATTNDYPGVTSTNLTINKDMDLTWQYATDHLLTTNSSVGGTISAPAGWVLQGSNVNVSSTANAGYRTAGISGMPAGATITSSNSLLITATFPMNTNYDLTANFVKTYNVTIVATNGALPNPAVGTYTYDSNAVVNFNAGPTITNVPGTSRMRPIGVRKVDY